MCFYIGILSCFKRRRQGAVGEATETEKKIVFLKSLDSLPHQKLSVLRYFDVSVFLLFSVNSFDINGNEDFSQLRNRSFIFLIRSIDP